MSVTAAPFPSNITMMDYINTTMYSVRPTQVNTTGPAFNNVTMMLTLSTIFMNTSESTSNVTSTTQKPRKISIKCIPEQLAKRYKPATLELLMKRTGLKVCTSKQVAVDRSVLISSHPEYKASAGILVYKYYVLLPLAVVSNGLLLLTVGKRMRKKSVFFNMGMLAIWDTLTIILRSIHNFLLRADVPIGLEGCRFFDFLGGMMGIVANWVLAVITVERGLAVLMPLKYKAFERVNWAILANVVIFVVSLGIKARTLALNSHEVFNGNTICKGPENPQVALALTWLDGLVYALIPLVIVIIFNVLIIVGLTKAASDRKALRAAGAPHKDSNQTSQKQITVMLLANSCAFALLTAPTVVFFLVVMTMDDSGMSSKEKAVILLARTVTLLLSDINHCINFYLYVVSSAGFRRDLSNIIKRVRGGTVSKKASDATSSGENGTVSTKLKSEKINIETSNTKL